MVNPEYEIASEEDGPAKERGYIADISTDRGDEASQFP